MAESIFDKPRFRDPQAARRYFESLRWPNGPTCPHCGATNRISKPKGNAYRPGLYHCGHCRNQFTVTVGTALEAIKTPLHKWIIAAALLASSKTRIPIRQLQRRLRVAYATAWSMNRCLRKAMKSLPEVDSKTLKRVDETLLRILSTRPRAHPRDDERRR